MTLTNDDIACYEMGERLFFSTEAGDVIAAKEVCFSCSARAWCLQVALDRDEEGVWGGFTEVERRLYVRLYGREVGDSVKDLDLAAFLEEAS